MKTTIMACMTLGLCLALASCGKTQSTSHTKESASETPSQMKSPNMKIPDLDAVEPEYTAGPMVLPKADLLAYFEGQEGSPVYKVPVVFVYDDEGFHMKEVFIGVSEDMDDADKLLLDPDDSGLGIGLDDRLRSTFEGAKVCHAWLIGKWGALLDLDLPGMEPEEGVYPFTVHDMEKREDGPTENAEARIWVR